MMKTINVTISDYAFNRLGLDRQNISFTEPADLINKEFTKQALNKCIEKAEETGLSEMSPEEINKEIKYLRRG